MNKEVLNAFRRSKPEEKAGFFLRRISEGEDENGITISKFKMEKANDKFFIVNSDDIFIDFLKKNSSNGSHIQMPTFVNYLKDHLEIAVNTKRGSGNLLICSNSTFEECSRYIEQCPHKAKIIKIDSDDYFTFLLYKGSTFYDSGFHIDGIENNTLYYDDYCKNYIKRLR
jgi:hypothetical protein